MTRLIEEGHVWRMRWLDPGEPVRLVVVVLARETAPQAPKQPAPAPKQPAPLPREKQRFVSSFKRNQSGVRTLALDELTSETRYSYRLSRAASMYADTRE